ncbi:response regulator transcription factor [Caulobacter sp. RHG1]|uniref:response regulator transcription factor n=1 Tax=Caulobacter sp. (strain RHG1) TaxID=2545762 RepID=UPI00155188C0|nr:response regulator transcription factor [Caulobacter sp. RHG1]NQE63574.1 hypothetical protein [Caulobacter sp. RHG1]
MRLLLVEDDPHLGPAMRRALEADRYAVDLAATAEDASAMARVHDYGVVLLDLGLPDGSGLEVLRDIRNRSRTLPVIVVTAQDRVAQRIAGLDMGADDYLVKPVDIDELLARVRAQLRRTEGRADQHLTARNVSLDLAGRVAFRDDQPVALTAKEFKLAALLLRRAGGFVSKEEIDTALHADDTVVSANAIEVTVSSIRRKLGADFVITARGLGYMAPR